MIMNFTRMFKLYWRCVVYVLCPSVPWSNDKASLLGFFIGSFLGSLIFLNVSFSKKHSTKDRNHFFIHVGHKKFLYENGLRGKMPWCELNKINTSISIWNPMRLWQLYLFEKAIISTASDVQGLWASLL